jgi:hypothetical protein
LKNILTKDLKLRWRKVNNNEQYVNTKNNIRLRHVFAQKIIGAMQEGQVILNFDESVINLTTNKSYSWCAKKTPKNRMIGKKISGLSMLVAVSSLGDIFFQYLDGNNNETSVAAFFIQLADELTKQRPAWRKDHVLVLDNCSSHKTPMVQEVLLKLGYSILYTAPASYLAMPIELLFAHIK